MPDLRPIAAGVVLRTRKTGLVLFLKRSAAEKNFASHWCLPGGGIDENETPEDAARRECREEVGYEISGRLRLVGDVATGSGNGRFITFESLVDAPFIADLDDGEHVGYAWAPPNAPPEPLHPGVAKMLPSLDDTRAQDAQLAMDRGPGAVVLYTRIPAGIAFDRNSVRSYDKDGRLHVEMTNISKANVCPYVGREIPGYEALGLDPEKIYQLLRDPEELERAAPTFNNLPVLKEHIPVSAEDHQPEMVIGSTGTNSTFTAPYLHNSLVIWSKDDIDDVENEEKRQLSSAYHYRPDMTPGTYAGVPFDGVMRDIIGNHVAVVKEGRAGADVVVGDSMESLTMAAKAKTLTIRSILLTGAMDAFMLPRLAKDAKIAFDATIIPTDLTKKNFAERRPKIVEAVRKAAHGKLAKDASIEGLSQVLDMIELQPELDIDPIPLRDVETPAMPSAGDPRMDAAPEFLKGKLSDDDYATVMDMLSAGAKDEKDEDDDEDDKEAKDEKDDKDEKGAKDEPPPFKGKPETGAKDMVSKKAMDHAIKLAVKGAQDTAAATQREIREAEQAVRPYVGEINIACDTAEQVYRHTLKALNVDVDGVHASALPAILKAQPVPGARTTRTHVAMDAAGSADFAKMFPDVARIGVC